MRRPELKLRLYMLTALVLLLGIGTAARASVAVLVEEPYGHLGGVDPAGHSAIYLDHVCAASPLKLRPCRAGEFGVVISRYDGIGGYDWAATPLVAYLYAVDSAEKIPNFANSQIEWQLRDEYRHAYLQDIASDTADGARPKGNWYELVGAAYDRTLYGFQVKTTTAQDAKLIALFNDRPNTTHYNGLFRNCADFDRVTVNLVYPKAIRRNFLADFGLTSPKQIAHGLSKYAAHHPEIGLTTFIVHQIPGPLPRSHANKGLAESLLTSPRYVIPITVFEPYATGIMAVAFIGNGRFRMPKEAPELSFAAPRDATPLKRAQLTPPQFPALPLGEVSASPAAFLQPVALNTATANPDPPIQ